MQSFPCVVEQMERHWFVRGDDKVFFWNKDLKAGTHVARALRGISTVSRDGQLAIVERIRHGTGFGQPDRLHIMDATSGKISKVLDMPGQPTLEAATFSQDGRKLYTLESHFIIEDLSPRG